MFTLDRRTSKTSNIFGTDVRKRKKFGGESTMCLKSK